jgi:hypothetical protein
MTFFQEIPTYDQVYLADMKIANSARSQAVRILLSGHLPLNLIQA